MSASFVDALSASGLRQAPELSPPHPLEPLSAREIQQAVELLQAHPGFTATTRIISIALREPEKSQVYAWPAITPGKREAVAVVFENAANQAARPHPHSAAGGLPGRVGGLYRLSAQAERLLRPQPFQRCAAFRPGQDFGVL